MISYSNISLRLNFNIYAAWKLELHKHIDSPGGRVNDLDQPLVGGERELLTGLLVNMRRPVDGIHMRFCWQRYRTKDDGIRLLHHINNP